MSDMKTVELHAAAFAEARAILAERVQAMQDAMLLVQREHIAGIRQAVTAALGDQDRLKAEIEACKPLFDQPRTRVFSGIKVGYRKQPGQIVIDDEEKTIALIRKLLPEDQAALLIVVKESVHKPSVADLTAADQKRLAIRVEADTDAVVIQPAEKIDKIVAALLKDAEGIGEAA